MTKVEFFENESSYKLKQKINDFIRNKNVISISYSTNTVGYGVYHFCCVVYME